MIVDRRLARDQRIDIGDRDQHTIEAVLAVAADLELIEVARFDVVDRRPGQLPQIPNLPDWCVAGTGGFRDGVRREVGFETVLDHGPAGDRVETERWLDMRFERTMA